MEIWIIEVLLYIYIYIYIYIYNIHTHKAMKWMQSCDTVYHSGKGGNMVDLCGSKFPVLRPEKPV